MKFDFSVDDLTKLLSTENRDLSKELVLECIAALKPIRYGTLEIVIHNSRVVQFTKTEKVRSP